MFTIRYSSDLEFLGWSKNDKIEEETISEESISPLQNYIPNVINLGKKLKLFEYFYSENNIFKKSTKLLLKYLLYFYLF
jgi:hypothetical protein